jgi:hypothetical protein
MSDEDELALLNILKSQPDFECLPLPGYWFKKYNLPPRAAVGPAEYIESNYAMKKANEPKELPPIIIDEPQQGGKVYPLAPPEVIDVKVINRKFAWDQSKPFPAVFVPTDQECRIPDSPDDTCPSVQRRYSCDEQGVSGTDLLAPPLDLPSSGEEKV